MNQSRAKYANECRSNIAKMTSDFNSYSDATYKPNFFGSGISDFATVAKVRGDMQNLRILAEGTKRYVGAKRTLDSLEDFDTKFSKFVTLKEHQLSVERDNPFITELSTYMRVYKDSIYRVLTDKTFEARAKRLIFDVEKKYNFHNSERLPLDFDKDKSKASEAVNNVIFKMSSLCREAK